MAATSGLAKRLEALIAARHAKTSRARWRAYATVCAEAGLMSGEPPEEFWTQVDATADLIYRAAKWYSHQRGPIRVAVAAILHAGRHDFLDYWSFSVAGRALFRDLRVHCYGNEEGTLALMQFYQANPDPDSLPEVSNRFHTIYRSLKTQHWLTVDTSYYPFAALAALQTNEPSLVLARWITLSDALRREGLSSKKQRFRTALLLSPVEENAVRLSASLCKIAKAARSAGLSARATSLTDVAFMERTGEDPARLAAAWHHFSRELEKGAIRMKPKDAASCAALLVLHDLMPSGPLREQLIQTKITSDVLRIVYRIRGENLAGGGWDDQGEPGGNGSGGGGF